MVQAYQNLSRYFPRLNIDKLKIIAKRWVGDNTDIPINRVVLYTCSSKNQKQVGETEREYAIVFEILKEYKYKKYGLTSQELQDYHEATDREEIITPDPIDEFFDREEITPDPIDEFIHDTEYFETIKPESPFLSFMTKDFEDVYWDTPKDFKNEWEIIPRPLVYNSEKKEIILKELPSYVRMSEPHEILFPVQTEEITQQDIPSADIRNETTEEDPEHFPPDIIDLMNKARPGIDLIYKTIKEGEVGFKDNSERAINDRMGEALFCFEYEDVFRGLEKDGLITKEDLKNRDIYETSYEQWQRSFKGKLLQTILVRRGFKRYPYAEVFMGYQKQKGN